MVGALGFEPRSAGLRVRYNKAAIRHTQNKTWWDWRVLAPLLRGKSSLLHFKASIPFYILAGVLGFEPNPSESESLMQTNYTSPLLYFLVVLQGIEPCHLRSKRSICSNRFEDRCRRLVTIQPLGCFKPTLIHLSYRGIYKSWGE